MSQLERLAEAVVQMGKQSGPAMETVDQSQRSAERLAVAVPNDSDGYSCTIRTHLYEASAALRDVARALAEFDRHAEAFANGLIGERSTGFNGLTHQDAGLGLEPSGDGSTLSSDQQDFIGSEFKTPGGSAFFAADDIEMRRSALALGSFPGEYTLDVHGTPSAVQIPIEGATKSLNASEFAAVVKASTAWNGQPIRLFSCNTGEGQNSFGQQLADALGVRVTAPNKPAWGGSGRPVVSDSVAKVVQGSWRFVPMDPPNGRWVVFLPRKV